MATTPASEPGGSDRRPAYGEGRTALLRAAIHVVATAGLRRLTYRAVAEAAGVTHGLVVHHFGTRDALIEQALRYSLESSVTNSELGDVTGSLDSFGRGLADFVTADPELQAFQYELILESRRRPELQPYVEELYDTYREAARRQLAADGITDVATTEAAFATLDGLVFQLLAHRDPSRTEAAIAALRDLLSSARDRA